MLNAICCILGLVIGGLAIFPAFAACIARIDSFDELDHLVRVDVILGGVFTVAFLLLSVPTLRGATRWRSIVSLVAAVMLWLAISGSLIWHHEWQVRFRSAP